MEISFGRLGGAPVGRRRNRREAGRRKAAGRAWVLAPASGNGFSKIFRQSNIRRTQPPAIRHPGSLRAFGDIHVTKLLFVERNIKKISFSFTMQWKSMPRLFRPASAWYSPCRPVLPCHAPAPLPSFPLASFFMALIKIVFCDSFKFSLDKFCLMLYCIN